MKPITTTCFAALLLFAISCKKENTTIQSIGNTDEGATQTISSEANELAGAHAVRIGTQVWMTKNLNVSRYRNGDWIPQVTNPAKWAELTTGAWCWYKNDSTNGAVFGKLYNWYAGNDPRGLAPEGWHIPSKAECTRLRTFLGGYMVAGGKMKSTGTIEAGTGLWHTPNGDATNSSGFTGLPGGYRRYDGTFQYIGYEGYWWRATASASAIGLFYGYGEMSISFFSPNPKQYGFSVRCIRDSL